MVGHSDFIVSYPSRDVNTYDEDMGRRTEFRELLITKDPNAPNMDDSFFYNYQMLVGRWWAPWTNNRIGLLRWDPGSGKTRGAFIFALMWMRHSSHKKTIFISSSDIVLRAIEDEVVKYNKYDVILNQGVYKQGSRAHGKTNRKSRYVKKQGFEKYNISAFMNRAREKFQIEYDKGRFETFKDYLVYTFKDYVVIVDEIHVLRGASKKKKQYDDIVEFLDAVRDVCPTLVMTATPVVNTWKDLFSIIGMLHPPDVRDEINAQIKNIKIYTKDQRDLDLISDLVYKYSRGLVSDRKSTNVVPKKVPIPGPHNMKDGKQIRFTVINNDEETILEENIFPLFMSSYQTEFTSILERSESLSSDVGDGEDTAGKILEKMSNENNLYLNVRLSYDFSLPIIEGEEKVKMESFIYQDPGTKQYFPTNTAIIRRIDADDENIFLISWRDPTPEDIEPWNKSLSDFYDNRGIQNGKLFTLDNVKFPRMDTGLGKYSTKYAYLIWMMRYHPIIQNMPGYVHTLWVEMGTKLIAASLNTNNWRQYTGNEAIDSPFIDNDGNTYPRFAIIDGSTKSTQLSRIIEAFNSPRNRDGSILRMVLGSRKSGISISLTNGRFFIELSADFNKATRIQSEGRVFRADSLLWMRELGMTREVFTADILAMPTIPSDEDTEDIIQEYMDDLSQGLILNKNYIELESDDRVYSINPLTIEASMYQLAEIKHSMGKIATDALERASIENIIHTYKDIRPDNTSHALLYGRQRRSNIRDNIVTSIPYNWTYPINIDNMYMMKTSADLVSNHTLVNTRYGMPRPVQSFGSILTATFDPQLVGRSSRDVGISPSLGELSLIYERNFFIVEEVRRYSIGSVDSTLSIISKSPLEEYEFIRYISDTNMGDIKAIALEMAISMPENTFSVQQVEDFNKRRSHILSLYSNFWNTFGGGRAIHILWYGIRNNSHLSKFGINSTPELGTRILTYDDTSSTTTNKWKYMDSKDREVIYLSSLTKNIAHQEGIARDNAREYGYYVHFSIYDGELRLRDVYMEDKRKTKTLEIDITTASDIISRIMNMSIESLSTTYGNNAIQLKKDFYYRSKSLGILIIR